MSEFRRPFLIISGEREGESPRVNLRQTAKLARMLRARGCEARAVHGVYKGASEVAFVVHFDDWNKELTRYRTLAAVLKQESILVVDRLNIASLYYCYGPIEALPGTWQKVPSDYAGDCYTQTKEAKYAVTA